MRLTTRNIRSLDPGEYRDAQVPGLILRVWDSGRAWALRYSHAGKRRRVDLGPLAAVDIEQARDLARLLIAGMVRGEDPRDTLRRHDSGALTVAQLCGRALDGLTLRPATLTDWRGRLRRDIAGSAIADMPATALTRASIRLWGEAIARRSGYSANRSFEFLRRAYSWGVERDILTATPFVRLPKPFAGEAPKAHVMPPAEISALMAALDAEPCGYADAVWLLLLTGVRRAEVEGARWSEITTPNYSGTIQGPLWTIPAERTKGGAAHQVPLSRQALAVIDRRRADSDGGEYLFPVTRGARGRPARVGAMRINPSYVAELREHVDGSRWSLHSFRAAFATHGQDIIGLDLGIVSAVLGHAAPGISRTTRTYYAQGKQIAARRDALQRWADWLDSIRPAAPGWITQREAAEILGLAESTLAYHRHRKQGPAHRIIRRRAWYRREDIEALKAANASRARGVAQGWPNAPKRSHHRTAA